MSYVTYDEALLVGDMESTFRTAGTPDLLTDTFDVGPVSMNPNFANLSRTAQRATMSPTPRRTGRRQNQFQFTMDLAGSGVTDASRTPPWSRFVRACGFAETQISGSELAYSRAFPDNARDGVALAEGAGSTFAGTLPRLVILEATGAAEVTVTATATSADAAHSATGVAAGTGVEVAGPNGSTVTLTYTGDLTVGDKYAFLFTPPGHLYTPVSSPGSFESMYLRAYESNKYHLLTGARGTFSMSATAGEYAQLNFSFVGDYNDPVDATFPTVGNYDYGPYPLPPMVENAYVQSNGRVLACPTTYGFDLAGTVTARLCANATGANDGAIITGREPTASFNMDAVALGVMDPWTEMKNASQLQIFGNVGSTADNIFSFLGNGQYNNVQPANLDGQRKYDTSLMLVDAGAGNDELILFST